MSNWICILFLLNCIFSCASNAQINRLISLEDYPGANLDMVIPGENGKYYVSLIYSGENGNTASALFSISEDAIIERASLDFGSSREGISLDEYLFDFGKNRSNSNLMQIRKFDKNLNFVKVDSIFSNSDYTFPVGSLRNRELGLFAFISDYNNPAKRTMNISFSDRNNTFNIVEYNQDLRYSYLDDLDWGQNESIYVSAGIGFQGQLGRLCQLNKIGYSGELIWKYNGIDEADNGAVACYIAPLSNGEIVQIYEVTGDQYPHIRMIWISEDGNFLRDQTIDVVDFDQLKYVDLVPGKGDYFFGYGWYIFGEDPRNLDWHGILTKFNNDGSVIWSRLYQHEELANRDNLHWFESIHEYNDGSILILANAEERFGEGFMWLFEVDSNGCFDPENCGDQQIITKLSEVNVSEDDRFLVFPNPVDEVLNVQHLEGGRLQIRDIQGRLMSDAVLEGEGQSKVDVSNLEAGLYVCTLITKNGLMKQRKIIVE